MKTIKSPLINDDQSLVSATSRFGHSIPTYDDGFGLLYIHRDSMGISGIVRAQTWESAYEICEDEFFPAAAESEAELAKEFSTQYLSGRELWLHDNHTWEQWTALTEVERNAVYSAPGRDVPFAGHYSDHPCFQEQYGYRSNGRKEKDGSISCLYVKDLNGDSLELLTPELLSQLEITLNIETNE